MARILVVEDSPSQAAIITEIVKQAGHDPIPCPDIARGVAQALKAHEPDIVLLDLMLLDEKGKSIADGFQICREIKRVSQGRVKVVIVTSKSAEESLEWAELQGADAFLQKPFAVEDLISVIDGVLA